jgi:hypothetical protein
MAGFVHGHVIHLRSHAAAIKIHLRVITRLQRLVADGLHASHSRQFASPISLFIPQIIVTVYFSFAVIVSAVSRSCKFIILSYLRIRRFFPPKKALRTVTHPNRSSRRLAPPRKYLCKKHCSAGTMCMQPRIRTLKLTLRRRLSYGNTKKNRCSRG